MSVAVQPIQHGIARCRVTLSIAAMIAVFIDPTQPLLGSRLPIESGPFEMDHLVLGILMIHFTYAFGVLRFLRARPVLPPGFDRITLAFDVLSGAAIAAFTEGISSPMYAFVVFAVIGAGLTAGLRRAMIVTAVSVTLYLSLIVISAPGQINFYIMRPIYLGIAGYLVGYLGEHRLRLEAGIRELAAAQQRQRIARDLHDGRAQAFAAINLQLASCQRLLRMGEIEQVREELSQLQTSVTEEYDEMRTYMRSLAGIDGSESGPAMNRKTVVDLNLNLKAPARLVDLILTIAREAVSNVCRHAYAREASIRVRHQGRGLLLEIEDDGVGFGADDPAPWTISSIVNELGGTIDIGSGDREGACLKIQVPLR